VALQHGCGCLLELAEEVPYKRTSELIGWSIHPSILWSVNQLVQLVDHGSANSSFSQSCQLIHWATSLF